MINRKKELKIRKTVRFDTDMVALIERESKRKSKPFSEVIRRAIFAQYVKSKKAKEK